MLCLFLILCQHKMERNWVLALLTEGLKDKDCYELYNHQGIFHVLLAFFNSPLCEESAQVSSVPNNI